MRIARIPRRLRRLAAGAVCAGALIGAACSQPDSRAERIANHEVIINVSADAKTFDPGQVQDINSGYCVSLFIRGLTVLDEVGNPHPEIAERWEVSADGRVYDFYLRETTWTNGDPVRAGDFLYSWRGRMLRPAYASEYAYMLFFIEGAQDYFEGKNEDPDSVGIEVVDARHLRVRLVGAAPFFPQVLAHHAFFAVNEKADRANPDWWQRPETYVGNGPFKFESYVPGYSLVGVKRKDGYWNAANVAMNKVTFRFIEEESTERIAFDNREIDGTYLVPRADIPELKASGALKLAPQIGTYYLNINMEHEAFKDPRVRRALAMSIDRKELVENVTRAGERPAYGIVPPELYENLPEKKYFPEPDLEEARRLMAEAGYPGGDGFPELGYLYNTLELHKANAQVIQETWKRELGVNIRLENQEFKVVIERRNQGRFDIARNGWVADFSDPINFLDLFLSYSGNNHTQWGDPKFDDLVERARMENDPVARIDLLRQAEDLFMEVLPVIPIYYYAHPYLSAPELHGYEMNPFLQFDVAKFRWVASEASGPTGGY